MKKYRPNLDAFNRPDQAFVLNRFNYIESILTKIVAEYIRPCPERRRFLESIVLNNAVVSFGSKLKLFFHINATEKWIVVKRDNFHRLLQIRNQFAHSGTQNITAIANNEESPSEAKVLLMLESVAGGGMLEQVDAETALDEFTQLYIEIREQLHAVLDRLLAQNG